MLGVGVGVLFVVVLWVCVVGWLCLLWALCRLWCLCVCAGLGVRVWLRLLFWWCFGGWVGCWGVLRVVWVWGYQGSGGLVGGRVEVRSW